MVEWVAISYSRGSSWPRNQTASLGHLYCQVDSLPLVPPGKPRIHLGKVVIINIYIYLLQKLSCIFILLFFYVIFILNNIDVNCWLEKTHDLKVENCVFFGGCTEGSNPAHRLSDSSEGLFLRGKWRARIYRSFAQTR